MFTPPQPLTPAVLLAAAAKMGWIVLDSQASLGTFSDSSARSHHLILVSGSAPGSVEWAIVDVLPTGFAPLLFSRETYEVMHGGTLRDDGSISYEGHAYHVRFWYDGSRFIAEAVAC
jgi:hypothetical protein